MSLLCSDSDKKSDPVCQKCPWFKGDFLPSLYSSKSELAIVQESPSSEDFLTSQIFSGTYGDMVDDWLSGFGLEFVHKFSAVKCSLGATKPGKEVVDVCRPHLISDIKHAQKHGLILAVPLGATATRAFFKVSLFGAVRGQPRKVDLEGVDVAVFPTLSPAHILSRRGEEALVRKDFKNIVRIAEGLSFESFFNESKTKTVVLRNKAMVEEFLTIILPKSRVVSLDLETTGYDYSSKKVTKSALNYLSGDILSFNFSNKEGVGYVLPLLGFEAKKVWSDNFKQRIFDWMRGVLEDSKILWCYHNAVFDIPWLVHHVGLDLEKHRYVDTLLMSHLLNEEAPKDLKTLATVHTGLGGYESVLNS